MRTLASTLLGSCALLAAACGGATTGGTPASTIKGQVGGQPVPTTDTVAIILNQSIPSANGTPTEMMSVEIGVTNVPNTCAVIQRHADPPNASVLSFSVTAQGTAVTAGTYVIGQSGSIVVRGVFGTTDASCAAKTTAQATRGTVTLTTLSDTSVEGSFDVTMATGDHLTGTFDAPVCKVPTAASGNATCGG